MDEWLSTVKQFYDQNADDEWSRLDGSPFEFILTTYMMEKHIKPGDSILDVGGGPGRYSIHFAKQGCDVTLVDLSEGNVNLALQKAADEGARIKAIAADCLTLDELDLNTYDHVFLMGPLYHLKDEQSRVRAVELALKRLKPGGIFYASFIMAFAGIIYDLRNGGYIERDSTDPILSKIIDVVEHGGAYSGPAFTNACFISQRDVEPFMARFPLERLHLFGQEGILAPNLNDVLKREQSEIDCWIGLAKRFIEVPELLSYSEHAMYIGRKPR